VGRTYQQELHTEALTEDVSHFIGRQHFRVERTWNKTWSIIPNERYVMWRSHNGKCTQITGVSQLEHGDSILIFTGACDGTPDGPGSLGTLHWTFYCPDSKSSETVLEKRDISSNPVQEDRELTPLHYRAQDTIQGDVLESELKLQPLLIPGYRVPCPITHQYGVNTRCKQSGKSDSSKMVVCNSSLENTCNKLATVEEVPE